MRSLATIARVFAALLLAHLAGSGLCPPAFADIDFAASLSIPLDDDGRVFINVASNHYRADPDVIIFAGNRLRRPVDEIPIVLFLAEQSRRSPRAIIDLRLGGRGWVDVFVSLGLPYSILFADLPPDPGPPYGKAWGYWKKHRGNPKARIVLTDAEFADLVHLRVTSRALGMAPREVIRLRAQGKPIRAIAGGAWRAKHGPPSGKPGSGKPGAGKPGGKEQSAGKGPGKDKPKGPGKP